MGQGHDPTSESFAAASDDAWSGEDLLSDVLRAVRLTGSLFFLVEAKTPWVSWAPCASAFVPVVLPGAQHMVSYHVIVSGSCWAGLDGGTPERMGPGDILVVPHGDAYFLAEPEVAPAPHSVADAVDFFRKMAGGKLPSIVPEGGGGACTEFICGFLGCDVRPFNPILSALPHVIHVRDAARASDRMSHLIAFALDELRERRQGGQGVLLRLSELMLVEVVRRCLETLPDAHAGWLAGLRDPIVGRALACLHREPARRWTLDALAAQAGASRSVLAQRFHDLVGQPPMQYLAAWRMQLATRLLDARDAKVSAVAEAVGYDSEAAFSRAFKKAAGTTPSRWRTTGRQAEDE